MNTLYSLSFETRGNKPVPMLIVSVNLSDEQEVLEAVKELTSNEHTEERARYLWNKPSSLRFSFENGFGYGTCGTIEKADEKMRFIFPLKKQKMRETSATISDLLFCLSTRIERYYRIVNENGQLFILRTRYGFGDHYSHAIVGDSSPLFKQWLDGYYQNQPEMKTQDRFKREIVFFPEHFVEAMALAWQKLSGRKPSQEAMDGVGGWVRGEQLFTFVCPGSAASAGTYPDEYGRISSHNVWAPEMQLTLLTGLFCLFEFIQKHPDAKSAP